MFKETRNGGMIVAPTHGLGVDEQFVYACHRPPQPYLSASTGSMGCGAWTPLTTSYVPQSGPEEGELKSPRAIGRSLVRAALCMPRR